VLSHPDVFSGLRDSEWIRSRSAVRACSIRGTFGVETDADSQRLRGGGLRIGRGDAGKRGSAGGRAPRARGFSEDEKESAPRARGFSEDERGMGRKFRGKISVRGGAGRIGEREPANRQMPGARRTRPGIWSKARRMSEWRNWPPCCVVRGEPGTAWCRRLRRRLSAGGEVPREMGGLSGPVSYRFPPQALDVVDFPGARGGLRLGVREREGHFSAAGRAESQP